MDAFESENESPKQGGTFDRRLFDSKVFKLGTAMVVTFRGRTKAAHCEKMTKEESATATLYSTSQTPKKSTKWKKLWIMTSKMMAPWNTR